MKPQRRSWSRRERRKIVEESLKPGLSVTEVAQAHGLTLNELSRWRVRYRDGLLEEEAGGRFLPVKVGGETKLTAGVVKAKPTIVGTIDIELGQLRVRIEGAADPDCVRAVVEGFIR